MLLPMVYCSLDALAIIHGREYLIKIIYTHRCYFINWQKSLF